MSRPDERPDDRLATIELPGSPPPTASRGDLVLRTVAAMLPASRRDWGRAMRAELAGIAGPADRRSFVAGCLRAAVTGPDAVPTVAAPVLSIAALVAAVILTEPASYANLRLGLIASTAVLVAVAWLGRHPVLAVANRPAGAVRAAGVAAVAVFAVASGVSMVHAGNPAEKLSTGVPIVMAVGAVYLLGVIVATTPHPGAPARVVVGGLLAGVGAGVLWTIGVLALPPVPATSGAAVIAMLVGVVVAGGVIARRGETRGTAALLAAAFAAQTIVLAVAFIAQWAPARFIPGSADPNPVGPTGRLLQVYPGPLTAASWVDQARAEVNDPYVAILGIGALCALALTVGVVAARRRRVDPGY
jgi:hypothetical protein